MRIILLIVVAYLKGLHPLDSSSYLEELKSLNPLQEGEKAEA